MRNTLIILAELHYKFGLIGCDEFNEFISFWDKHKENETYK